MKMRQIISGELYSKKYESSLIKYKLQILTKFQVAREIEII